ncbi:RNA polymerase II elongation factor ELL isoform X3 [Rhinoraja longicauda]
MAAAAALGEERSFGLSCGRRAGCRQRLSIYHLKLTDTALRALEAYERLAASSPDQPVICFQGKQGQYIKIPAPKSECHDGVRCFSFYLSTDSKDKPQASFDCIHQYVSSFERNQLECLGSIQDKITVCATDDSYQMTRDRMSQVEKESWSRATIEIKPGTSYQGTRKPISVRKQTTSPATDGVPVQKQSPTSNLCLGVKKNHVTSITQKPLRDRITHLLALKPYKKPELIVWLEREKANPKDKAELSCILDQVAKLNVKDNSYTLKDELYKEIQQDWPGYSDEEKQLIRRQLIRKYSAITSLELCQNYRNDFNAEYNEYRDLHTRIGNVTEQFMQLGSKIKTLSPGTEEYKMAEDQIFEKYRKFKKAHPTYREEKIRCEYLHRKLSHIKQLIIEYDQQNKP